MECDLIYVSPVRWESSGKLALKVTERTASRRKVLFVEAPIEGGWTQPCLSLRFTPSGVMVVVPLKPAGMKSDDVTPIHGEMLRAVVDDLGFERYLLWTGVEVGEAITRLLDPVARRYDILGQLEVAGEVTAQRDSVWHGHQKLSA